MTPDSDAPRLAASQRTVGVEELEAGLERALAVSPSEEAGLFGPESMVWRVNRHAVVFLGAGRAALLQLLHPWVATAIEQHSNTKDDPMGRFHRTFRNVFAMVYGSRSQATAAARRVHALHQTIHGTLADGAPYLANQVDALLWVHATLWETSIHVFERTVGSLTPAERDAYYQETRRFAWLFGIPDDALPDDWEAFLAYNQAMWRSTVLRPTPPAVAMAGFLFRPLAPGTGPAMRWLRRMTAGLFPDEQRAGLGLEFGPPQEVTFARSLRLVRWIEQRLPRRLRYLPPYIDGVRRVAGKPTPDRLGRLLNRALLGGPESNSPTRR